MDHDERGAAWRYQVEAAARGYAETEPERRDVEQQRKATDTAVVDTSEQITARADRLLKSGEVPARAVIELGKEQPLGGLAWLERIIERGQSPAGGELPSARRSGGRDG